MTDNRIIITTSTGISKSIINKDPFFYSDSSLLDKTTLEGDIFNHSNLTDLVLEPDNYILPKYLHQDQQINIVDVD